MATNTDTSTLHVHEHGSRQYGVSRAVAGKEKRDRYGLHSYPFFTGRQ